MLSVPPLPPDACVRCDTVTVPVAIVPLIDPSNWVVCESLMVCPLLALLLLELVLPRIAEVGPLTDVSAPNCSDDWLLPHVNEMGVPSPVSPILPVTFAGSVVLIVNLALPVRFLVTVHTWPVDWFVDVSISVVLNEPV